MSVESERRKDSRANLQEPVLCILHAKGVACNIETCTDDLLYLFADIKNIGIDGLLLQTPFHFPAGTNVAVAIIDKTKSNWDVYSATIVWTKRISVGLYLTGIEYRDNNPKLFHEVSWELDPSKPSPADLSFLLDSSLFQAISHIGLSILLNSLQKKTANPGERLIAQGQPGDFLYLIQKGSCIVHVAKNNAQHKVAKLKAGDVAGEMAVLTGEPRTANVDAETEMVLWKLDRLQFDCLAQVYPELRLFLTEIMANRFNNSIFMGERVIGKYLLTNKIGKGGWGIVYRGFHRILKMPVAIKMMKHDMAMEPLFLETFRKEAETIARMRHPNIVSVYDIEEMYKTVFIIMEYLEGWSLKEYLGRVGQLSVPCCASILAQVCDGLSCAHRYDIVHRDIKPGNIFIMENDHVKLLDFGLACAPGTEDLSIAGTLYYASPEQIHGEPVDHRSDIYSMGIMAYEMITGQRPYPEDNLARLMELHCQEDIPDPIERVPNISESLRKFILKCCRRELRNRYQNAAQAKADLLPIFDAHPKLHDSINKAENSLTSLILFHTSDQEQALKDLLEEFGARANALGVAMHMSEFKVFR